MQTIVKVVGIYTTMSSVWQLLETHLIEGPEFDLKKLINHVAQRYGDHEASQLSDYMQDNVGNDDPEVIQTLIRSVQKRYDPQALALAKKLLPPVNKTAPPKKRQDDTEPLYTDPETAKVKSASIDAIRQQKADRGPTADPSKMGKSGGIGTQLTLKQKDQDLADLPVSADIQKLQKLQQYVRQYPEGKPKFKKDGSPDIERSRAELEAVKAAIAKLGKGGDSTIKKSVGMQPDQFWAKDDDEQPALSTDTPEGLQAKIDRIEKTLSDNPDHPNAAKLKVQADKLKGRKRRLGNVPQQMSVLKAQIKDIEAELKADPNHPDADALNGKLDSFKAQVDKLKKAAPVKINTGGTPDPTFDGERFGQFWSPNAYSAPEDDELAAAEADVERNPNDRAAQVKLAALKRRTGGFEKKPTVRPDTATGQMARGSTEQNPSTPRSVTTGRGDTKQKWTDEHGKYWVTRELGKHYKYPNGWVPKSVFAIVRADLVAHAKKKAGQNK